MLRIDAYTDWVAFEATDVLANLVRQLGQGSGLNLVLAEHASQHHFQRGLVVLGRNGLIRRELH